MGVQYCIVKFCKFYELVEDLGMLTRLICSYNLTLARLLTTINQI